MKWSLPSMLSSIHAEVELRLSTARAAFAHPGTKGDASQDVWLELLKSYLPHRYQVASAHVADSHGNFSEQIDAVVFDRHYSPFAFCFGEQVIVPAESVYAVFEAKQTINATNVRYAQGKIASVRRLHRTSLPIPSASGIQAPKSLHRIVGGLLALDSEWKNPSLGQPLIGALNDDLNDGLIDLGCVASHGIFECDGSNSYTINTEPSAATHFLFELIARLQDFGTVPMIDVRAYADWIGKPE